MVEDHQAFLFESLHITERHPTVFGMLLDPFKLVLVELAGFKQDVVWNPDLADVVKRCSQNNAFDFGVPQSHADSDSAAVTGNTAAVAPGVLVTQVDQRDKGASHGD